MAFLPSGETMIFYATWLPPVWFGVAALAWAALLAKFTPVFFRTIRATPFNVLLAAAVIVGFNLIGLTLDSGHLAGMSFHLLGLNLAALISNRQSAFCLGSCSTTMLVLAQQTAQLTALPLTVMLTVAPACLLFPLLERAVQRFLPPQLFVYIFIRGFLGSAATMLLTGLLTVALIRQTGAFSGSFTTSALPVFFLLTWSEAFLSGIAVALMIAFKPSCLLSFDEQRYLKPKPQIWK